MLATLALTVGVLVLVVAGASIGVMFKRQPLQGSCGGLGALGFEKACACKQPCDIAQEHLATQQYKANKAQGKVKSVGNSQVDSAYVNDRTGEGKYTAE